MTYPQGGAVPVLTTLDRDTWADVCNFVEYCLIWEGRKEEKRRGNKGGEGLI